MTRGVIKNALAVRNEQTNRSPSESEIGKKTADSVKLQNAPVKYETDVAIFLTFNVKISLNTVVTPVKRVASYRKKDTSGGDSLKIISLKIEILFGIKFRGIVMIQ